MAGEERFYYPVQEFFGIFCCAYGLPYSSTGPLPKARSVSGSFPTRIMPAAYRMAAYLLPLGTPRTHRTAYGVCTWSLGRGSPGVWWGTSVINLNRAVV
jgi:hypothetical protein